MLFTTFVLAVFASFLAIVQATSNSCPAGSILGIYAMCGTDPVDCGKGLCCLDGQTCVTGGCTDPKLTDDSGKVLTVSAACYGSIQSHQSTPSGAVSTATGSSATTSTIATQSHVAQSGAGGSSGSTSYTGAPYTNGTRSASGGAGATSTGSGAGSTGSGLALSNGATSLSSVQSTMALLFSAVAIVALWL
jgi:hypothetical protein